MLPHRFKEGDPVFITTLRKGGVITEVLHGGSYRVAIASLTIVCAEDVLKPAESREAPRPSQPSSKQRESRVVAASLDLHGYTVDEATRRLEEWLSQAVMAGLSHVKVVHGLGTGRVQRAVHQVLSRVSTIRAFRINDANPGETDIYL